MSSLPVFADTLSRLHADIALIRLIRAGIRADRISAVFPRRQAPNAVCCWLKVFQAVPHARTVPIAAAGLLSSFMKRGLATLSGGRRRQNGPEAGLEREQLVRIVERTELGRIVLCVHARNENEAAIAWHILHHVGAENITCPAADAMLAAPVMPPAEPHWGVLAA